MSMPSNGGPPGAPPQQDQAQPQFVVVAQYIKDFSFENPNAPRSLNPQQQPQFNISVNVNANASTATDVEVALKLEGKAEIPGMILFQFDLEYAGIFRISGVPQESLGPLTLIECPRLLFPFAREIIANACANAGFLPLLLQPIDFVALYQQRMAQVQPSPPQAQPS